MALIKIKDFSKIDFENINPAVDIFEIPEGKKYRFSDHVCHECWSGGTVLETIDTDVEYYCVMCERPLRWVEFENDFVEPREGTISFLLPASYSGEELAEWIKDYREHRKIQENFKDELMLFGKE